MQLVFTWIVNHPKWCIALATLITLGMSSGLRNLKIDASTQSLFPLDEPEVKYHRDVKENFGSDSIVTVVASGDSIFESENLKILRGLSQELSEIDGASRVLSLFTVDYVSLENRFLEAKPILTKIPEDQESQSQLRSRISKTPLVSGFLVNESQTAIAFHIILKPDKKDQQFDKRIVELLSEKTERINKSPGGSIDAYIVGAPIIKVSAAQYIWHDLVVLGPIALLIIGSVIFFFYRSLLTTFLPLFTGVLSVIATLGFMGFAGFAINPFASVIVVLLLVMGCTEDLHIMAEYSLGLRSKLSREDAIRALGRTVFSALFLTSITTILGFASIAPNPISGLREFAIACAIGIFINFLLTLLLVPAILRLGPGPKSFLRSKEPDLGRPRDFLVWAIRKNSGLIAFVTIVLSFVAIIGVAKIGIDTSYLRFFPKDSIVGKTHRKFARDFGGASTFVVTVETGGRNGVYRLDELSEIAKLHDFLKGRFEHTMGLVDLARDFERQQSDGPVKSELTIKSEKSLAQLRSLFGSSLLSPFVDFDGSRTAIRVRSLIVGSQGMREAEDAILNFARQNLPDTLEVRVTGERVLTARFSDKITRQLVWNLVILSLVVALLLSVFFRSAKFGMLAIIPNALPVLFTFGYMGWAGIPLSTGTFSVAIVAFGIAVDDTIHFMTRFFHESKKDASPEVILKRTLTSEIRPIFATSAALILGYLVLVFSPFLIHRETGILFSIAISTALLADLFVTPVLLNAAAGKNPRNRGEKKIDQPCLD